jgi:hypothetical protein
VTEGRDRIEHSDRKQIGTFDAVNGDRASVFFPELRGDLVPRIHDKPAEGTDLLAIVGRTKLVDVLDRMFGQPARLGDGSGLDSMPTAICALLHHR